MNTIKKRRITVAFVTALALVFTALPNVTDAAAIQQKNLYVNGTAVSGEPVPYVNGKTVMVPLKLAAQALGYTVTYNPADRSIHVVNADRSATAYLGQNKYIQNASDAIKLSAAVTAKKGISVVPADFFTAILDCGVQVTDKDVRIFQNPVLRDKNQTIALNVGDSFSVELSDTPSTGHIWSFVAPDGLSLQSLVEVSPKIGQVGAPILKNRLFKADKEGTFTLTFNQKRGNEAAIKTCKYTVIVSKRTSKSPANVTGGKLEFNKNDRFTIYLGEGGSGNAGLAWDYSGIKRASTTTSMSVTMITATAANQEYTNPDGSTGKAINAGDLITNTAIITNTGSESISLASRSVQINTGAEGIKDFPSVRIMNFYANHIGTYNLKLTYDNRNARLKEPVTINYHVTIK